MKKLEHDLLTNKYTEVWHEETEQMKYNAPHNFYVEKSGIDMSGVLHGDICTGDEEFVFGLPCAIHFQEGPIKECGVNGVCNEDLIAMVIIRLEHFQKSEFACSENALAITNLEQAMLWLRKRTMGRENRGVEGTHKV